jgi:chromosome segregation ATPase
MLTRLTSWFGRPSGSRAASTERRAQNGLQRAYRDLLLENQVLTEGQRRLSERLERAEKRLAESPTAQRLIRTQREALTDKSLKLRQQELLNRRLDERCRDLQRDYRRQRKRLEREAAARQDLERQLEFSVQTSATLEQQLVAARRDLATLTDRYYQLQARIDPALSSDRVVTADFQSATRDAGAGARLPRVQ